VDVLFLFPEKKKYQKETSRRGNPLEWVVPRQGQWLPTISDAGFLEGNEGFIRTALHAG